MTKPLGYYASAPSGTKDAGILAHVENSYGSHLEKLTDAQKSALLIGRCGKGNDVVAKMER